MSKKGEKLAALYAIGCPQEEREEALLDFLENNENRDEALEVLKSLDPFKWFQIIAKENNIKDVWRVEVVRALWTGNRLTKEMEYKGRIVLPFHNFDILAPGPDPLYVTDAHKVSVGKIVEILKDTKEFLVERRRLVWRDNKFQLEEEIKRRKIKRGFIKDVKIGDLVTFHFASTREIIKQKDADFLIKKTEEAINLFNSSSDKSPVKL